MDDHWLRSILDPGFSADFAASQRAGPAGHLEAPPDAGATAETLGRRGPRDPGDLAESRPSDG